MHTITLTLLLFGIAIASLLYIAWTANKIWRLLAEQERRRRFMDR